MLIEVHWNLEFFMVISHPGVHNKSICDRQMGLNGIVVEYQQHYVSDQEKENRWDHQNGLHNFFLSLWMWVIPKVLWSN